MTIQINDPTGVLQRITGYVGAAAQPDSIYDDARHRALIDAAAQLNSGSPLNPNIQPTLGPNNPIAGAASIPTNLPPLFTSHIPIGGGPGMTMEAPTGTLAAPMPARPVTPTPASAYPVQTQPARPVTPTPATAYRPAATPAAAAPSMFGLIDRQNAAATANQPGRGYQTALDLSGLFGGGRPNPADVPAANATPMVGGPLAKGSNVLKAPWNVGPMQRGMVFPSEMGPKRDVNIARSRIKAPDYYGG